MGKTTQINFIEENDSSSVPKAKKEQKGKMKRKKRILHHIRADQINTFPSPINKLLDIQLLRIGTIADGNCFIHALLKAFYPPYSNKPKNVQSSLSRYRKNMIKQVRKLLSDKLDYNSYFSLGDKELSVHETLQILREFLEEYLIYSGPFDMPLEDYFEDEDVEGVAILDEYLFDQIFGKSQNSDYDTLKNNFISSLRNLGFLEEGKADINVIEKIFEIAPQEAFKDYKERLSQSGVWIGQGEEDVDAIEYISNMFGIDIYFIDSSTRLPKRWGANCNLLYKHRPSIVLHYIDEFHFEVLAVREIPFSHTKAEVEYTSHFEPSNKFINYLYNYINLDA